MINRVTLLGNLGDDPEVRVLETGVHVAKLRIATNENYKDRNSGEWITNTEWHNVVLWRQMAERAKSFQKGNMLYIEGKLTHRQYQDKDNNTRYITEVVANYTRLIPRGESSGSNNYTDNGENQSQPTQKNANEPAATDADQGADDLPF